VPAETVDNLVEFLYEDMGPFVNPSVSGSTRRKSLEKVVQITTEFAVVAKRQPSRFSIYWRPSSAAERIGTPFNQRTMEPVSNLPTGVAGKSIQVSAVVFPGLLKRNQNGQNLLLAKILVLLA
jgi:hypothetical protein